MIDVFQRNLTDHISNSKLYEKFGSILLSRAMRRESVR